MPPAIEARGLTKRYRDVEALVDVDLTVEPGQIYGYLGPNGAGKTTTLRLFVDLLRPTAGTVRILGLDPTADSVEVRRRVGYLPGELILPERFTAAELFRAWAGLRERAVDRGLVDHLCERLELDPTRPVGDLSRGNRQKVGVVQSLMHRPQLLVWDEPTTGLDPLVQNTVLTLAEEARGAGATVFMSSHVLSEVERAADRVAIIRQGRLVADETVAALKGRAVRRMEIRFAEPVDPQAFARLDPVREVVAEDRLLRLVVEGEVDQVVKAAAAHHVETLLSHEADLEEIFLGYYREQEAP